MFTGLVECLGTIRGLTTAGTGRDLTVTAHFVTHLAVGESVAVNGVCLTVVERESEAFRFQVGPETLLRTNLGELVAGDRVNLERSLRAGDRLGGHWVQGHIDGVGWIEKRLPEGEWETIWFRCPADLTAQMVSKGSIAVDGISLTLVAVESERFSVALIPHTLAVTTLGFKRSGDTVNLETDILAKYVHKAMQAQFAATGPRVEPST
jgi:riboflavin synthase